MVTIQSAMLLLLGFSIAGLLACVLAPAYRRRAERLATEALKKAMPLTEAEIAADKDRIRAESAIRIHKLESNLSETSLETARQLVEINRRDARISALESDVARLETVNDEHENARRVLELTITERLPKVEQRLAEAKKLLFERDREIAALTQSAQKQALALQEATQINTQQRDDIHRLNATLTTRAARSRDLAEDQRHETEIALRTEIEALRARVRDQQQMLARLQAGDPGEAENEMARLRESLAEAERALQSARSDGSKAETALMADEAADAKIVELQAMISEQAAEISRLKDTLAGWQAQPDAGALVEVVSNGESVAALKARIDALEQQAAEQMSTILGLRAEVAAGNEKLARQATFYMDEMRRLGAGTRPVVNPAATATPAQAVNNPPPSPLPRVSLSERIKAPRVASVEISASGQKSPGTQDSAQSREASADPARGSTEREQPVTPRSGDETSEKSSAGRRPSLLQRITSLEKPVA